MGWELGIDKDFRKAPEFFWLFTISVVVGALTILVPNMPLLAVMYVSQVINGVVLPFVLICMVGADFGAGHHAVPVDEDRVGMGAAHVDTTKHCGPLASRPFRVEMPSGGDGTLFWYGYC